MDEDIDGDANQFTFHVWDEINGCREEATRIQAWGPTDAAESYAECDNDGWVDGLYHDPPQPIVVENERGERTVYEVYAEVSYDFRARLKA